MLKDKKIIIVTHVFVTGAADALEEYLIENEVKSLIFIAHPFSFCPEINSYYRKYRKGRLVREGKAIGWKLPNILLYVKDVIYTLKWVLFFSEKVDIFIGLDNLNAFTGLLLKKIGKVRKVIFYTIDYIPQRFRSKLLNKIYHFIDSYCVKHCDWIWNVADAMVEGREKKGIPKRYRTKQVTVPIGTDLSVSPLSLDEIEKSTIVYVGHLRKKMGLELLVESLPQLRKHIPQIRLVIMGRGPLEGRLRQKVEELGLRDRVEFTGFIKSHRELQERLRRYTLGVAPYVDDEENYTRYADPAKPKAYMGLGLPVIITRVPWIAEEVEKRKMGIAINYDKKELIDAVVKLLNDDEFYTMCRENALEFASKLSWDSIYDRAFKEIEETNN